MNNNNKKPLIIRPCDICTQALGTELIASDYFIANNLVGEEYELVKNNLNFLNNKINKKFNHDAKILQTLKNKINKFKKDYQIWVLPYQSQDSIWKLCLEQGWQRAFVSPSLVDKLENKNKLISLFGQENFLIPGEILDPKKFDFKKLQNKYGKKIVLQISRKKGKQFSGGKGTFFIETENELQNIIKAQTEKVDFKINKYIKGDSLGVNACVTQTGVLVTNFWMQIISPKNISLGSTVFQGTDFSSTKNYSPIVNKQIQKITIKVANKLKKVGFRGIFGLDFLFEFKTNKIYLMEINPRLAGTTSIMHYFYEKIGAPALLDFHLKTFRQEQITKSELVKAQNFLSKPIQGSQFLLRSLETTTMQIKKAPLPGIYVWDSKKNRLRFLRSGWNPLHLQTKKEFLVYAIVPKDYHLSSQGQMCRLVSWSGALAGDSYHLNKEFLQIAKYLYKQFKFEKV